MLKSAGVSVFTITAYVAGILRSNLARVSLLKGLASSAATAA